MNWTEIRKKGRARETLVELSNAGWTQKQAAAALGIHKNYLYRIAAKHGIKWKNCRGNTMPWVEKSIFDITRCVSREIKVSVNNIYSKERVRRIAQARFVAMWFAQRAGFSCPDIGRCFSRDHTNVLHGCRWVDRKRKTQEDFVDTLDAIQARIDEMKIKKQKAKRFQKISSVEFARMTDAQRLELAKKETNPMAALAWAEGHRRAVPETFLPNSISTTTQLVIDSLPFGYQKPQAEKLGISRMAMGSAIVRGRELGLIQNVGTPAHPQYERTAND